jgi:hypothetical protein
LPEIRAIFTERSNRRKREKEILFKEHKIAPFLPFSGLNLVGCSASAGDTSKLYAAWKG